MFQHSLSLSFLVIFICFFYIDNAAASHGSVPTPLTTEQIIKMNRVTLCGAGMQDFRIKNTQVTASSTINNNKDQFQFYPYYARLFQQIGGGYWTVARGASTSANSWIQVDLLNPMTVYAVVTQGSTKHYWLEWVTSYNVLYRNAFGNFRTVTDSSGEAATFSGNYDQHTPVINELHKPITARYFRIAPKTWNKRVSLRFDLLLCPAN